MWFGRGHLLSSTRCCGCRNGHGSGCRTQPDTHEDPLAQAIASPAAAANAVAGAEGLVRNMSNGEQAAAAANHGNDTPNTAGGLLAAALGYASNGWRVFPLKPGTKTPMTSRGHHNATTDEAQIRAWWTTWPDANIGLVAGDGLAVLDVDPRNGGDDTLKALIEEYGPICTRSVQTGSGGKHFYFHDDAEAPLRHGTGRLGRGLDIKAGGRGYVVAPPSVHPNGREYEWGDSNQVIEPVPKWMRRLSGVGGARVGELTGAQLESLAAPGDEPERLRWTRHVLDAISNGGQFDSRDAWIGMAHAIRASCGAGLEQQAFELFDNFSQRWTGGPYDPDETQRAWETLGASDRTAGYTTLLNAAGRPYSYPTDHPWRPENEFSMIALPDDTAGSKRTEADEAYATALQRIAALGHVIEGPEFVAALSDAQKAIAGVGSFQERAHAEALLLQQLERKLGRNGAARVLNAPLACANEGPAFLTLEELMERPELLRAPRAVVPYLAYEGRVTLLAGPDKSGKSTLAAQAAASKTRGIDFLGQPTSPGKVLVIAPDESLGDTVRRLADFKADPSRVKMLTRPTPGLLEEVEAIIREWQPDFIIIDSLQAVARHVLGEAPQSGDASAWSEIMRPLADIAHAHGVAILVLHHVRKSDGEARDSSEILAAVDGTLTMRLPRSADDRRTRRITGRARWPIDPFTVALRGEGAEARYELVGGQVELSLDARILLYVQNNPGASRTAVRNGVMGRGEQISGAIDRLIKRGELQERHEGRRSALYVPDRYAEACADFS
jgi:hypothetical protein